MILEIAQTIRDAQKQLMSVSEAEALAEQIAAQKQSAFPSTQEFIDASLAAGVLILSNNDTAAIKVLSEQQKKQFKALFALGCDTLDDSLAKHLNGFCNLREVDLSYANGMTDAGLKSAFNGGRDLCALETLYLRMYRKMEFPLLRWHEHCSRLHSLFVDGNPQVQPTSLFVAFGKLPSLKALSIVGCTPMASPSARGAMSEVVPFRKIRGYPECRISGP